MTLTLRQKQWASALASIGVQGAIFVTLDLYVGHLVSAVVILLINIALSASYKSANPLLVGARWSAFFNLSWAAYARHSYWYPYVQESMTRLRNFEQPLEWTQRLCGGNWEAGLLTTVTGFLIIVFYYYLARWPEWTERWESLRRAPLSASLGLQTLITTVVVYPTPWSIACALFFAGVISPLVRRQVRFNHIVFLSLLPLFSLGSQPVAFIAAFVAGYFFLYFVSVERALTANVASFSVFAGVAFLALVVSIAEDFGLKNFSGDWAGLFALACFLISISGSYLLLLRGDETMAAVRRFQIKFTPTWIKKAAWWTVRDLWVDREVDHRLHKRYKLREQKKELSLFIFGPRHWMPGTEEYARVVHAPKLNYVPAGIVLAFYSMWLYLDAVVNLAPANLTIVAGALSAGFLIVIGIPVGFLYKELRKGRKLSLLNTFGALTSAGIFAVFMAGIFYFGLGSSDALQRQQQQQQTQQVQEQAAQAQDTPCNCQSGKDAAPLFR